MNKLFAALLVAVITLTATAQAIASPVFALRVTPGGGAATTYSTTPVGNIGFVGSPPTATYTGTGGSKFTVLPNGFGASFELNNGEIKLAVGFGTNPLPSGVNHDLAGAGSYTVALTLTDIMVPTGQVWDWANAFTAGHTTGGIVSSIDIYLDPGNGAFATTTPLTALSSTVTGATTTTLNTELLNSLLPTSPFSMTAIVTVTFPGSSLGANNAFSASVTGTAVAVPEPASLALLGFGLLGVAMALRRRKNPAKANVNA